MTCIYSLQKSIDFIEDNLKSDITLNDCAQSAGYSPFHYCRAFQMVSGMTAMEYVRKRRLSQAAKEIYDSCRDIKDIGFDWGFNSQENFLRAFQKQFGFLPSIYRKSKYSLDLVRKLTIQSEPFDQKVLKDGVTPRIISLPQMTIAGMYMRTSLQNERNLHEIPCFWGNYYKKRPWEHIPHQKQGGPREDYGLGIGYTPYDSKMGCYDVFDWIGGVVVEKLENIPEGIVARVVPASKYAVFSSPPADSTSFIETMQQTWRYIILVWLPNSLYIHTGTHEFSIYCQERDTFSKDIFIPII